MIIDCHGHYTTAPAALQKFRDEQINGLKTGIDVPLSALRSPQFRGEYEWGTADRAKSKFPAILYGGQTIWGLTLRITMNLLDILDGKTVNGKTLDGKAL